MGALGPRAVERGGAPNIMFCLCDHPQIFPRWVPSPLPGLARMQACPRAQTLASSSCYFFAVRGVWDSPEKLRFPRKWRVCPVRKLAGVASTQFCVHVLLSLWMGQWCCPSLRPSGALGQ